MCSAEVLLKSGIQYANGTQELVPILRGPMEDVKIADTEANLVLQMIDQKATGTAYEAIQRSQRAQKKGCEAPRPHVALRTVAHRITVVHNREIARLGVLAEIAHMVVGGYLIFDPAGRLLGAARYAEPFRWPPTAIIFRRRAGRVTEAEVLAFLEAWS
jgi:hypothetical protein